MEIAPELVERMVYLLRRQVKKFAHEVNVTDAVKEAREIVALLTAPVDPDLIEARKLVAERYNLSTSSEAVEATLAGEDDDTRAVKNCLRAIKRGRELAGGASC